MSPSDTPPPTPRLVRVLACLVFLVTYGGLGLAYGLPSGWEGADTLLERLSWNGVLLRQVLPQAGLALTAVIAWACRRGRRRLALALLPALAVCLGPTAWQLRPRGDAPAGGVSLRVVTANLLWTNRSPELLERELLAARPDVLVVQEVTEAWAARLNRSLESWPHRVVLPRADAFGVAVYSKRPLRSVERLPLSEFKEPQLRVDVEVEGRRVTLYAVHLLPPNSWELARVQRRQAGRLLARLAAEPGPVILAGDLNATERSPIADALEAQGFVDALDLRGWGPETTWPVLDGMRHLPSMRLDHVYLKGLGCRSARTGVGAGSDHRPVVVEAILD